MALTRALLDLRGRHPDLFANGTYTPLEATGSMADHVFTYLRRRRSDWVMVVVPRFSLRMTSAQGWAPGVWAETAVAAPGPVQTWRNVLTGREVANSTDIPIGELLADVPVAIYEGRSGR